MTHRSSVAAAAAVAEVDVAAGVGPDLAAALAGAAFVAESRVAPGAAELAAFHRAVASVGDREAEWEGDSEVQRLRPAATSAGQEQLLGRQRTSKSVLTMVREAAVGQGSEIDPVWAIGRGSEIAREPATVAIGLIIDTTIGKMFTTPGTTATGVGTGDMAPAISILGPRGASLPRQLVSPRGPPDPFFTTPAMMSTPILTGTRLQPLNTPRSTTRSRS